MARFTFRKIRIKFPETKVNFQKEANTIPKLLPKSSNHSEIEKANQYKEIFLITLRKSNTNIS